MKRFGVWAALFLTVIILSSCSAEKSANIHITDAKTALGVNEKYMPVNPTNVFAEGTDKVFLWFSWKEAVKDTKIVAKWYYITEDMPVLDYTFTIPRKEGSGSVSLSMPEGKRLPGGVYRVTLEADGQQLKSLTFKVLESK